MYYLYPPQHLLFELDFASVAERSLPMAGRLDLKGCSDSEEDLGISRGYNQFHGEIFHDLAAEIGYCICLKALA